MNRQQANLKSLDETDALQNKTGEAIVRIQRNLGETEEVGTRTLEELRRQDQTLVCPL